MVDFHTVIGTVAGDEGKGTITAQIAANSSNVLNVLTNGGAQRGHTVVFEDGDKLIRKTNKHFGSATYLHTANYFSSSFILDPMQFKVEYESYGTYFNFGGFYRHPNCRWVTPFDIMANQAEAKARGVHNTCGMGIWKTIQRFANSSYSMPFDMFIELDFDKRIEYLKNIAKYYEPEMMRYNQKEYNIFFNDETIQMDLIFHFISDCEFMHMNTSLVGDSFFELDRKFDTVICENGQGLAIGDDGTDDAQKTPTKTGLAALPKEFESYIHKNHVTNVIHYVSRTYETRHGDDKTFDDMASKYISSYIKEDTDNHYNMWQGSFKYAPLDVGKLNERIAKDLKGYGESLIINLDLTHCDEVGPEGIICPLAHYTSHRGSPIVRVKK